MTQALDHVAAGAKQLPMSGLGAFGWIKGKIALRLMALGVCSLALGFVEILKLSEASQLVSDISNGADNGSGQLVFVALLFCVIHPALFMAVIYIRNVLVNIVSYNQIGRGFFGTLMSQPYHRIRRHSSGEVLNYSNDFPGSIIALGIVWLSDIGFFVAFIGMLAFVLLQTSGLLMLPVLFWVIALIVLGAFNFRRIDRIAVDAMQSSAALAGTKTDLLDNYALIKTAAGDDFHIRHITARFEDVLHKGGHLARRTSILLGAVNLINGLTLGLGVVILYYLQARGEADIAMFVLFIPVMLQLAAISQIALEAVNSALISMGKLAHIRKVFQGAQTGDKDHYTLSGVVEAEAISLRHPEARSFVLERASFRFEKGARIGISAPSGQGKSTLLLAIANLLRPQEGRLLAGTETDRIAICTQDPLMFNTTVAQNLLYGAAQGAQDRIPQVLEWLELADDLEAAGGLEQEIAPRGNSLSGGQKQRLALARALLSDPQILILDEALSGVDEAQEDRILALLDRHFPQTTMIVSSHRSASLARCSARYTIADKKLVTLPEQPG